MIPIWMKDSFPSLCTLFAWHLLVSSIKKCHLPSPDLIYVHTQTLCTLSSSQWMHSVGSKISQISKISARAESGGARESSVMGAQAVPRVIQGHLQVCSLPGLLLKRMVGMWTLCDPSLPSPPHSWSGCRWCFRSLNAWSLRDDALGIHPWLHSSFSSFCCCLCRSNIWSGLEWLLQTEPWLEKWCVTSRWKVIIKNPQKKKKNLSSSHSQTTQVPPVSRQSIELLLNSLGRTGRWAQREELLAAHLVLGKGDFTGEKSLTPILPLSTHFHENHSENRACVCYSTRVT